MIKIRPFFHAAIAIVTLLLSLLFYTNPVKSEITSLAPTTAPVAGVGWQIESKSGSAEIQLAKYLTKTGAKMYGAYWCPHCHEQKQLFGKQAWEQVNYIECAADAVKKPQPKVCDRAGIKGFPTWSIDGKNDPGVKTLAQLAKQTHYKGNTAFKYDRLFSK
jgi:glutaredoxin